MIKVNKENYWRQQRLNIIKDGKRSKRKEIRLSESELTYIEDIAKSLELNISDYIREISIYGDVKFLDLSILNDFINLISSLSNNINQIARCFNIAKKNNAISDSSISLLSKELQKYSDLINELENLSDIMVIKINQLSLGGSNGNNKVLGSKR